MAVGGGRAQLGENDNSGHMPNRTSAQFRATLHPRPREGRRNRVNDATSRFLALDKFRQTLLASDEAFAKESPAYRAALTSVYLKVRKAAPSNPAGPVLHKKQFCDAVRIALGSPNCDELVAALGNPNFPVRAPALFDEAFLVAANPASREAAMNNPNVLLAGSEARLQMALLEPARAHSFAGSAGWELSSRRFEEIIAGRPTASVCALVRHAVPTDASGWRSAFDRCVIHPDIASAMSENPRLPDEVRAAIAISTK